VLSRGLAWVRQNPMFISALTVDMGAPPAAAVDEYFDTFNATAAHLWASGLPAEVDGWRAARPGARWLSWVQFDGTNPAGVVLGGYPANAPGRIGYQIGDEPQTLAAFQGMAAGVAAVRAADPDALIVLNYNDSAPLGQLLDLHAGAGADVFSYDNYSRKKDQYPVLAKLRAAGLKYGQPYWRYLRTYYETGSTQELDESDCRWDAYVGLVYGFTGHTWFIYQIGPNPQLNSGLFSAGASFTAPKTPTYPVVSQLNLELRHLGRAITQLTSTDVRYVAAFSFLQPTGTQGWAPGAGQDPFITAIHPASSAGLADLLAGFFVDAAGERYVMIQNLRHAHGNWPLDNAGALATEVEFDFGAAAVNRAQVLRLDPVTGNVVTQALTSTGPTTATLAMTLPAGGAVLFKYATGKPFMLGP
jgi:hypothetical protein